MHWPGSRRRSREKDLEDELAFDLAAEAEERVRAGMPAEQARVASQRDFGNAVRIKEDIREGWGWTALGRLGQDVRYGWRALRKSPSFSVVAALSLALGIGANTAIYSVMDAMLFRALPVKNPQELAILNWRAIKPPASGWAEPAGIRTVDGSIRTGPGGERISPDFPWPFYALLRNGNEVFSTAFAYKDAGQLVLSVQGHAEPGQVEFVSGNFFSGLGVAPAAGRLISDSDNAGDAPPVAVLSYKYWRDRFAGDATAIGRQIRVGTISFTVCGVAAPEFSGIAPGSAPALYIPIGTRTSIISDSVADADETISMFTDSHYYWTDVMGRLRPGITLARAELVTATQFRQFALGQGANNSRGDLPALWLEEGGSGLDSLRQRYSKPLFVLMAMVGLILAIVCANITNLLLARSAVRQREMAIRLSLGAGRGRVIRQLLTESVLFAIPGGILGLGLASIGIRLLLWLLAGGNEAFPVQAHLDWPILAFTITVTFATGILFGLAPALEATRVRIARSLKVTGASSRAGRRFGLSQILVTAQIALSLVLVLGAVLFVRTVANFHAIDVGYNAANLLTFDLNASKGGYRQAALTAFYTQTEERLRALPGVRGVTVTASPIAAGSYGTPVLLPGNQKGSAGWDSVGDSFFETMQVPIVLGRALSSRDREGAPPVTVVNEAFARKYFPNGNAIGQHIKILDGWRDVTIVGVARSFWRTLKAPPWPFLYLSYRQFAAPAWRGMFFEVRTAGDPLLLAASVRKALAEATPEVPITNLTTQSQRIENSLTQERMFADLCTAFAILALTTACVGLYGSMTCSVSRRTNEIGIRMALGAQRWGVIRMIMQEVLAVTVAGMVIGFACARTVMPAIGSFLFGVRAADSPVIFCVAGVLILSLLLAGYAPAQRASRIDPLSAIRNE